MSRTKDKIKLEHYAMPTVGGDPIVESGSNSDGEWTRWADGTQQVSDSRTVTDQAIDNAYGNLYTGSRIVSYPVLFVSPATHISCTGKWGTGAPWGSNTPGSQNDQCALSFTDIVSRAVGTNFLYSYIAFGYWK